MLDFLKDLAKILTIIFFIAFSFWLFGWLVGAKTNERNVNEYNAIFDQIDKEFIESQKPIIIDSNEYRDF